MKAALAHTPHVDPCSITNSKVETRAITIEEMRGWADPPFQRELLVNSKVMEVCAQILADKGRIPGVLTLGVLNKTTYRIDGQHRGEAFFRTGLSVGYADVRTLYFNSMAEMGLEFNRLNSSLVRMRPDDHLRSLEDSVPALALMRKKCPFVGYAHVRRGDKGSPTLSMSVALRSWFGSAPEHPTPGGAVPRLAERMPVDDALLAIDFLHLAEIAWGHDSNYAVMWNGLNLTLCMWLYRRMVLKPYSQRVPQLNKEQFKQCLMALTASTNYVAWLRGRLLTDNDRGPAYSRVCTIFRRVLKDFFGEKVAMPAPAWASHGGTARKAMV